MIENDQTTKPVSPHLRVGLGAIAVAVGYVAVVLVLGWGAIPCLLGVAMLCSLCFGGIAVLAGLALKANRQRPRVWKHIAVLFANVALLFLLSVGPGNYFGLIDLRTRLAVMLTGGQGRLQAWAVEILDRPRDDMESDGYRRWEVPNELWSEQVRRLRPPRVYIEPLFEGGLQGIRLPYGSAFFHWQIVVGRPGSRPEPTRNDPDSDNAWFRWSDGIYDWQQY